jgi:hypothetical protein
VFVGHYGVSFAASRADRRLPLWLTFLAVQWVDILWSVFVLLGVEKVRIVPGITATNALDLYYMPYTHGLLTSLGWAVLVALAYAWLARPAGQWRSGALLGAAVFSHWILDLVVHRPDLPLWGDSAKVGLGLWNHPVPAFLLEAAVLVCGIVLYWPLLPGRARRIALGLLGLAMLLIQLRVFFAMAPPSPRQTAVMALVFYVAFAWAAYRIGGRQAEHPRDGETPA